jgi:hypothetical protein
MESSFVFSGRSLGKEQRQRYRILSILLSRPYGIILEVKEHLKADMTSNHFLRFGKKNKFLIYNYRIDREAKTENLKASNLTLIKFKTNL